MEFFKVALIIILQKSGQQLLELLPYVLLGVIIGEVLKLTSWTKLIYKSISHSPYLSIIISAALGILSPLCTYGTIPVVLQLFNAGISIAPLLAFLSASTMMNPQLFIITWGGLGLSMAIARTIAVMFISVIVGILVKYIPLEWVINTNILSDRPSHRGSDCNISKVFTIKSFLKNIWASLEFIGFYIVIGIVLGTVVEIMVPANLLQKVFVSNQWLSILSAALLGIPLYACGGGIIPLIRTLMQQGMSRGSALAFCLVGPTTRVSAIMALAALFRPLFIIIYVLVTLGLSVLAGIIY